MMRVVALVSCRANERHGLPGTGQPGDRPRQAAWRQEMRCVSYTAGRPGAGRGGGQYGPGEQMDGGPGAACRAPVGWRPSDGRRLPP